MGRRLCLMCQRISEDGCLFLHQPRASALTSCHFLPKQTQRQGATRAFPSQCSWRADIPCLSYETPLVFRRLRGKPKHTRRRRRTCSAVQRCPDATLCVFACQTVGWQLQRLAGLIQLQRLVPCSSWRHVSS